MRDDTPKVVLRVEDDRFPRVHKPICMDCWTSKKTTASVFVFSLRNREHLRLKLVSLTVDPERNKKGI